MKIFLEQQLERTNYWLSFAETKNGVLVAFNIAIIAVVAQIDKIPLEMQAVICILFSLSTLICFFSFFSNLRNKINNKEGENIDEFNLLFYNDIAKIKDTDMYLNALKGRYNLKIKENEKKLYEDFITEIVINSEIAVYKYNMFNKSMFIDAFSICLFIIAFIVAQFYYSPLNGTGLKPVIRTLKESGYTNITVVKEQEQSDGTFPTCPYPNPEVRQAMELGIEYAKKNNADLLLATDPDCDRVGIAVKNTQGEYVLLSGNETGMLLLDYICSRRTQMKTMPEDPVAVKTIVTIDMAERIAAKYGVKTINVLTGFKFIGEQIGFLEKQGEEDSYIFGMEESYGYLSGSYVRDKDGVNAAFLICEMFTYYASQGIGLFEKLNELYAEYGYCLNTLHSYTFEGSAGFEKMQNIMVSFRKSITEFAGKKVLKCFDYSEGIDGLPKSDVLKFFLEDNCSIVVRPSGTEPKLKAYISVSATTKEEAQVVEGKLARAVEEKMQKEKKLFYYPFDDKSLMVPFSSYRWGGWHKR